MPCPRREQVRTQYSSAYQHVSDLCRGHPTQLSHPHPHPPSPPRQPSQITMMMMMMTTIMPAESAYRLFQTETRRHRHRNQPGDGGMALFDIMSAFFFFFSSPFPLRVRRQTVSGREWVGSSCGDGVLTGVGMEAADALMQVSWIVKGPPVGPADSHLPTLFFFPQFFLALSRRWSGRLSVSLRPSHAPLPSPLPPWCVPIVP